MDPTRSGRKTSEFTINVAAVALMLLRDKIGLDLDAYDAESINYMIGGVAMAYTLGRSIVKGLAARKNSEEE